MSDEELDHALLSAWWRFRRVGDPAELKKFRAALYLFHNVSHHQFHTAGIRLAERLQLQQSEGIIDAEIVS